jgi:formylmethanofuran dehydrogenase subunit E-like metal-binding protein
MSANFLLSEEGKAYWGNLKGSYAKFDSGGDELSIMTISNVWALDDPRETQLLAASQLHDHICPGLIAGQYLASYLYEELPLAQGEQYHIIGCPCYCKDDYFTYVMHTTPGLMTLTSIPLSAEDQERLPAEAKDAAGVFIRWDPSTNTGTGLVLTFSFGQVESDSGIDASYWYSFGDWKWWWARLKADIAMMDYLDTPERYVGTYMEFDIANKAELDRLKAAGANPYVELGIIP